MKILRKAQVLFVSVLMIGMIAVPFTATAYAAEKSAGSENLLCQVFPFLTSLSDKNGGSILCGTNTDSGDTVLSNIGSLVQFALSLVFIGIIGVAIFYIIKSAIVYIRSEGNEDKVQSAQKAIKSVFVGVAALFVGIIGLVIIIVFFGSTGALNQGDSTTPDAVDQILNP